MLNFRPTGGGLVGRHLTSTCVRSVRDDGLDLLKVYTCTLRLDGANAGHVDFKASARENCVGVVKGNKAAAVEFDNLSVEEHLRTHGLAMLLLWLGAWHAQRKNYTQGTVRSISTVGSYLTFSSAGFAPVGASPAHQNQIDNLPGLIAMPGAEVNGDSALLAQGPAVALNTIRGYCAARIIGRFGTLPVMPA